MTSRPHVRVGRVYDERTEADGLRVLVDRMWPRGLTKAAADLDDWCKTVAPSTELRHWYAHDPERYDEFARRYRLEMEEPTRGRSAWRGCGSRRKDARSPCSPPPSDPRSARPPCWSRSSRVGHTAEDRQG